MAYLPPLNGGRVNATISGNTTGAGSLVSSGTMILAGGNNITLSQAGNAITISGASQTLQTQGIQTVNIGGNTSGTTANISSGVLALYGGNNITLSQLTGAAGNTVIISASNQTVQTQNIQNVSIAGNTSGTLANISSGTLTLAGGNNITLSQNGNGVTISGAGGIGLANSQTTYTSGTANLAVAGGALTIASAAGQSFNFSVPQTSSLSATGIVSISTNGGTISIGAPAQTVQTQNMVSINGLTGNIFFSNSNNISYGSAASGASSIITASASFSQSNQSLNLFANGTSNTLGQSSATTMDARSLNVAGQGAVSVGFSSGTMQISAPAQTTQTQNMVSINGSTGNIQLSNFNNVSFGPLGGGTAASVLTASASFSQTNQTLGLFAGGNTAPYSSTATADARSLSFNGLGNINVGYSNGSIQISGATAAANINLSAGTTSNNVSAIAFSNLNNVSFGLSGSTITGSVAPTPDAGVWGNLPGGSTYGATGSNTNGIALYAGAGIGLSQANNTNGASVTIIGGGPTLAGWEYPNAFLSLSAISQSALSLQHMYVPFNVVGSAMRIGGSLSAATFTLNTTASVNMSMWMGIYSLTGSTLSQLSSGSALNAFSWGSGAAAVASISGIRQLTAPINISMTPGEYWVGALLNTASTYSGATLTVYGNSLAPSSTVLAPIGSSASATQNIFLGQGVYTTTLNSLPATIPTASINALSSNVFRAAFYNNIYNATY